MRCEGFVSDMVPKVAPDSRAAVRVARAVLHGAPALARARFACRK